MSAAVAWLDVHGWHTECRSCGYGKGGWPAAGLGKDVPILTPDSRECHGCGVLFTHAYEIYGGKTTELERAAA